MSAIRPGCYAVRLQTLHFSLPARRYPARPQLAPFGASLRPGHPAHRDARAARARRPSARARRPSPGHPTQPDAPAVRVPPERVRAAGASGIPRCPGPPFVDRRRTARTVSAIPGRGIRPGPMPPFRPPPGREGKKKAPRFPGGLFVYSSIRCSRCRTVSTLPFFTNASASMRSGSPVDSCFPVTCPSLTHTRGAA